MADIDLIIKIPEEQKKMVDAIMELPSQVENDLVSAIRYGTILPKGHGRILDEKDILESENNDGGWYDLVDMPAYIAGVRAIIGADKPESEDKNDTDK